MTAGAVQSAGSDSPLAYRPRDYQLEMFEASMKENIIVAMDTGSGKTQIAVMRIMAELERSPPEKIVWFLAPKVALSAQQYEVISAQLPAVNCRLLTGLDNVDRWTEQSTWDAVLKGIRVVVSTHAVLADAMSHGFVKISQLALLVFDEAHHCTKKSPAHRIMRDFYHPTRARDGPSAVPHILGLTASPIVRGDPQELMTIESNLHSVCRTPRVHRSELLTHTYRPRLQRIWFKPSDPVDVNDSKGSRTLQALIQAWERLDIENDPYVKRLRQDPRECDTLQKTLLTRRTNCNIELKRFVERSRHIFEELGQWATDYFIQASIEQQRSDVSMDWDDDEKAYITDFLSKIPLPSVPADFTDADHGRISSKLESLIAFLGHSHAPEFSGLIFVTQRATISVLAKVLSVHPLTKDRFRCAAYAGWSGNRRHRIGELLDVKMQRDTLAEFRDGRKNLIITTDVLEEGIDVSACRLVICYNKPMNLKAFVQRRGRARQKHSTYAIMIATNDQSPDLQKWRDLEKTMIEAYQDDARRALESVTEDVTERLEVQSTRAVLTADTAMAHLHHFCSVLPHEPYVDLRPAFSLQTKAGLLKGTAILPACVNPKVRRTQGSSWWQTERAAMKDAAFQAYKSLYELGLVNDNLLPLTKTQELSFSPHMPSIIEVSEQLDPWINMAHAWSLLNVHRTMITVECNGEVDSDLSMNLTLPSLIPPLEPLTLFWDSDTIFTLSFQPAKQVSNELELETVNDIRNITYFYLQAPHSRPTQEHKDIVTLFSPIIPDDELRAWLNQYQGSQPALKQYSSSRCQDTHSFGLVRDKLNYNAPYVFKRWCVSMRDDLQPEVEIECFRISRRRNLLQRQTLALAPDSDQCTLKSTTSTNTKILSAETCTIDKLPSRQAMLGLFIPAIVDQLEVSLVATRLRKTILKDVGFRSNRHIITAITAPSAQALTNYQRYEFFGDSILKFAVSCQLFIQHSNWHEGYLSEIRDRLIQNSHLARVALHTGLDAFIINKTFTPRKWCAPSISAKKALKPDRRRQLSSKVLADVVEALIGAAYFEGGHAMARACIHRFLPEISTEMPDFASLVPPRSSDSPHAKNHNHHLVATAELKQHIGYSFHDESLLIEALTHPSCEWDERTESYQRLEFLGDAVLDMVVVSTISSHQQTDISPGEMTMIKHAVVNANLLAYLCMEFTPPPSSSSSTIIKMDQNGAQLLFPCSSANHTKLPGLWRFMRSQGQELSASRGRCLARHGFFRSEIQSHLSSGRQYPWELLARLNADKFFSDIVESVLGAIFVDSAGDLGECERFLERIGLLGYLRRVMRDAVDVTHPRAVVQRLAKSETVLYVVTREKKKKKDQHDDDRVGSYRCVVTVNGREVVSIDDCLTGEEAEVRAANAAARFLASSSSSSSSSSGPNHQMDEMDLDL